MTQRACCSELVWNQEARNLACTPASGRVRFFALTLTLVLSFAALAQGQCTGCAPPTPYTGWKPTITARAQFQLQGVSTQCAIGGFNTNVSSKAVNGALVSPDVYDIDLYAAYGATCPKYPTGAVNTDAVNAIHAAGKKAICYVDIGSIENYRPDYQDFVNFNNSCSGCLIGNKAFGANEKWLNLNNDKGQRDWLIGEMTKRVAKCQQAGFDGVYFDEGWIWQVKNSGWTVDGNTQLLYNTAMLNVAHSYNLATAINYDLPQIPTLVPYEDFHIDEQCFQYNECSTLLPVVQASKAVFQIEYKSNQSTVCPKEPGTYNWNTKFKNTSLYDYPWQTCF